MIDFSEKSADVLHPESTPQRVELKWSGISAGIERQTLPAAAVGDEEP
jgi:hypothetical protein